MLELEPKGKIQKKCSRDRDSAGVRKSKRKLLDPTALLLPMPDEQ